MLQLHKQLDAAAEKLSSSRQSGGDGVDVASVRSGGRDVDAASQWQRQMDLEVELLERKVRLFVNQAELLASREQSINVSVSIRRSLFSLESVFSQLVAWHSGRTSVSGRRTFPVLHSTCS